MLAPCVVRPRTIQQAGRHKLLSSSEARNNLRVLDRVLRRACELVTVTVKRIGQAIRCAVKPTAGGVPGLISDLTRSRTELLIENALLRQQLIVLRRCLKRPKIRRHESGSKVTQAARSQHPFVPAIPASSLLRG